MTEAKADDDGKDKADKQEPVTVETPSLVGSGAKMVTVKANAGCMGLAYDQQATFPETAELTANISNGNLSVIES